MADAKDDDLEAQGLIANSYDALFLIRKRIRKINDLTLPTRSGVATNQIGVGILVFIIATITYGFIGLPIMRLIGIQPTWWITASWLLGPPILAAQRIAKPMADGKSIGGTVSSWFRYHLDDRVHRRGVPVPKPEQPQDMSVLHYQREWVMSDKFAPLVSGEADFSDPDTERRMRKADPIELQGWYDGKAVEHLTRETDARTTRDEDNMSQVQFRRGSTATVLVPDNDENE